MTGPIMVQNYNAALLVHLYVAIAPLYFHYFHLQANDFGPLQLLARSLQNQTCGHEVT